LPIGDRAFPFSFLPIGDRSFPLNTLLSNEDRAFFNKALLP
jgi:hypothetical protein